MSGHGRKVGRERHRSRFVLASRVSAMAGVTGLVASAVLVALVPASAVAATDGATDPSAYSKTQTITRDHRETDGTTTTLESKTVTVMVDHTENLRGRERVRITWSGARPTAGRASDPYGLNGYRQEYPVVIMQCRGIDDPSLPLDEQLQPETCWTSTSAQRAVLEPTSNAIWQHDMYASAADTGNADPATWPADCTLLGPTFPQHLTPFVTAKGATFSGCTEATMPPEAALDAALPAAEIYAFTALDGTGSVQFEVRTETENESLGCSATVPCSIVVIPIMGVSCADGNSSCNQDGKLEPGSLAAGGGYDDAVSARYWWSESNWRNRFSVPLTFALPPDVCDILDTRAPVDMFGSELLAQASLQWAPAYCLRADRFKYHHNVMSDASGLRLLGTGGGVAAFVSEPAASATPELGYAPVAVTGFAVGYVADLTDNRGELTTMRLTPRLLAKLLTQSYPASSGGKLEPGLGTNPLSLNRDPEFIELNPGVSLTESEAKATLLFLNQASDVVTAVTSYIAADPEAMAFINGEADPWGMTVNPAYKAISLPRDEWPLLDTWVLPAQEGSCEATITQAYQTRLAAPVGTLRTIATALLDAWPNTQTRCERTATTEPWTKGRGPRQDYGTRFMLGLVSLGDAERYGIRTAELRTAGTRTGATFVGASQASMTAALPAIRQSAPGMPFRIDRTALSDAAYPGTMIVHAAARLSGLAAADADHVAQFIRTVTTEGQVAGSGNGELPAGYVPITSAGPTAAMYASAQAVATAIDNQVGTMVPAATTTTTTTTPPASRAPAATTPGAAAPDQVSGLPADEVPDEAPVVVLGETVTQSTAAGQAAVPLALGIGLVGMIGAPALRLFSTRRRMS